MSYLKNLFLFFINFTFLSLILAQFILYYVVYISMLQRSVLRFLWLSNKSKAIWKKSCRCYEHIV